MATLAVKVESRVYNEKISIIPAQKPPFEVGLSWKLVPKNDQTEVTFTINAELNMMMKMMASGPLQKLADHETSSLAAAVK